MNNIEVIIVLLLLVMAVPDLCRKLRRPALAYSAFVVFGFLLRPLINDEVVTLFRQAGHVGFLLLLFEVGLEIDLPRVREFWPALRTAAIWMWAQLPLTVLLASYVGLGTTESLVAAVALTGCSVGMAYGAWRGLPVFPRARKHLVLHCMVALEMLSIAGMAVGSTALREGFSSWVLLRLFGMVLVIVLMARFASRISGIFQRIIFQATQWRLHWLTLLILAICAVGNRLGLDAAKTAFFLGLAMSRTKHHGMNLEAYMAPVSQRFLIPLFFMSLGLQLDWSRLTWRSTLLALGAAGVLLGVREILQRRWLLKTTGPGLVFLLLSPNLTLAALGSSVLLERGQNADAASWLLLTGLFLTIPALLLLPGTASDAASPASELSSLVPGPSRPNPQLPEPGPAVPRVVELAVDSPRSA